MIVGDPQPEDYIYIGLREGTQVWTHNDIVAASVGDVGEAGSKPAGQ